MKKGKLKSNSSGLNLEHPRLIAAEASFMSRFLIYFSVLLLGISGAYACFYTAFPISVSWWIIIPCAIGLSTAFTALFLKKKGGMAGGIMLLILFNVCWNSSFFLQGGLADVGKSPLIQGFIHTINTVVFAYNQKGNYGFISLPAEATSLSGVTASCTVFAVSVLSLLTFLMAWLLIRRKSTFLSLLLTMPFLTASLLFNIIPHYAAVAVLLIFWGFLLLISSALHSRKGLFRKENVFYDDGNTAAHPTSLILLPILAACLLLISVIFPMGSAQRSDVVDDLKSGLSSMPELSSLLRSGGVAGNVNRVNLQLAGNIKYTGKTVLRVQSERRDTEYLKGFVGSVYTGQSWGALPEEDYRELNELLKEQKVQNFPYLFSQLLSSKQDQQNQYNLTVQNVGGNPRSIYTPYGLLSGPDDLQGLDFVNDGYLKSGNSLFGTQTYQMKAIKLPTDYQNMTLYSRLVSRFAENSQGQTLGALALAKDFQKDFNSSIRQMDEWRIPGQLAGVLSSAQNSFVQTAQAYTRFVYEHYTQLPDNLKDSLDQYRKEHALDLEHFSWPYALARAIIDQVQSENTYTLSPGVTPEGRDFVQYFLFENHQGYCMHFASATAVLLRSAGIPARYVEGYTVSPSDFRDVNGWADIPDSRAHAWVEIYLSGVGWVPVEATPSAQNGVSGTEPAATAPAADESVNEPQEAPSELSQEPPVEESSGAVSSAPQISDGTGDAEMTPSGRFSGKAIDMLLQVLPFFVMIVLTWAFFFFNRKLRMASRNKEFRQKDHSKAALAVYRYILQLLPYVEPGLNSTDGVPEDLYELVLKARFSRHRLTEEELGQLLAYAEGLAEQIRGTATLLCRFRCAYIYGLW